MRFASAESGFDSPWLHSPNTSSPSPVAAVVALLTFIVYLPALGNRYVTWDDHHYIISNLNIRSLNLDLLRWAFTTTHEGNWHPLTWISHALDLAVWGTNPLGPHLVNNLLHALNTFLVVVLCCRLMQARRERETAAPAALSPFRIAAAAAIAGTLFGIHPLHVESAAWISERKDLLCAVFYLSCVLAYVRYVRDGAVLTREGSGLDRRYLASIVFMALALMSKAMAVTLPAVLLLLDVYPFGRIRDAAAFRRALVEKIPFAALSVAVSGVTFLAQRSAGSMGTVPPALGVRLIVAVYACGEYLLKMIAPFELCAFYPYPLDVSLRQPGFAIPALLAAAITIGVLLASRRNGAWLAAWASYLVILLPVTGLVVQVGIQLIADRYTYLPSVGLFLLAGLGASALVSDRTGESRRTPAGRFAAVLLLAVGVALSVLTIRQIGVWQDGVTLWSRVIELQGDRALLAYVNRGMEYTNFGQYDKAIADFDHALAMESAPWTVYMGSGFFRDAKFNRALVVMASGLNARPGAPRTENEPLPPAPGASDAETYIRLGVSYGKSGQLEKGIEQFGKAIALQPGNALAYGNRGHAYAMLGRFPEALKDFDRAIEMDPRYAAAHWKRGNLHLRMGNRTQALADLKRACDLGYADGCRDLESLKASSSGAGNRR